MEESRAIHKLVEAQDLVGMVEEMLKPDMMDRLTPAAWSGIRITLRNVKDSIGASHNVMAQELVQRSKGMVNSQSQNASPSPRQDSQNKINALIVAERQSNSENQKGSNFHEEIRINPPISRRDLKASLERLVERQ